MGVVAVALVCGAAQPAAADAVTQPARVQASAWYRPAPTCSLPTGCLPVSVPAVYPTGTLHVGVLAGQEESRAYVSLQLPTGGAVTGGSLVLPVGPSSDGTVSPEAAKVRACLVTGVVKDKVEGDMTTAPVASCDVASPAVVKTSGAMTTLTVNLAPFASEWSGESLGSLALVPDPSVAPTDAWHVAFSRPDRTGAGIQPITASLTATAEGASAPSSGEPQAPSTDSGTGEALAPQLPTATLPDTVVPGTLPPQMATGDTAQPPSIAGGSRPTLVASTSQIADTSFGYPGVFLLPPLLLMAVAWFARAFTRDLAEEQL